jgi:hypothetical protein
LDFDMTDTTNTQLNLGKLMHLSRALMDAQICTVRDLDGYVKMTYPKPTKQLSPLSGTGMKWVTRLIESVSNAGSYVPSQIDAELHLPNATVGHNVLHGTSVFAAGLTALELQRIAMAKSGLPRAELDLLSESDVNFLGVTITYLIPCGSLDGAIKLIENVLITAQVLGLKLRFYESTNKTVKLFCRDYAIVFYNKTDMSHCKWQEGAPEDLLLEAADEMVRVEVKLGQNYLAQQNWATLESWRNAYAEGRYERIFNETVQKTLRLDNQLRHKAPREEVFFKLTPTEAALLRDYLAGGDPRRFSSVQSSKNPVNRYSELRRQILEIAKVDVNIPWVNHIELRCFELDELLVYPGDYHPSPELAPWCFCKDNFPNILAQLRQVYENTLKGAAALAGRKPDL